MVFVFFFSFFELLLGFFESKLPHTYFLCVNIILAAK